MESPRHPAPRIAVRIVAADAITAAGAATILPGHPRILLAAKDTAADVTLFATADATAEDIRQLRDLSAQPGPVVLLANQVGEAHLFGLIECGVLGIVDRTTATGTALAEALVAPADDHGVMSTLLLGRLLGMVRTMQRETLGALGLNSAGLTEREVQVLRMLADGAETAEIAERLTYSESTIKHVLRGLTIRFKFRNRVHAVASAMRAGVL